MADIITSLVALQMSGGSTYTNEPKTITENGIYIPDSGVRWNEVTVDVPHNTSAIMQTIADLPVHTSVELADGYRIDFSVDLENAVPVHETRIRWGYWYPQGGGDITIYPDLKATRMTAFAKIYKSGVLQFAKYNTTSEGWYSQKVYSASDGQALFLNSDEFFSDVSEAAANITSFSEARNAADITITFKFKDNRIYYNTDGSISSHNISDYSSTVYFSDISSCNNFKQVVTDLDFDGMAKALIGLHVALIHTKGFDVKIDISNI